MQMWVIRLTVFHCNNAKGPTSVYNDFNYQNENTKPVWCQNPCNFMNIPTKPSLKSIAPKRLVLTLVSPSDYLKPSCTILFTYAIFIMKSL